MRDPVQQNDQGCRHRVLREYPKGGIEHSPGSGSDRITRSVTALEAAARESGRDPNTLQCVGHFSYGYDPELVVRGPCSRMQGPSVEGSALPVQALTQAVLAKGRVTLDRLRSRALE